MGASSLQSRLINSINIVDPCRQYWRCDQHQTESRTMKANDLRITRQAATEALGVRQQTLYAYVSRGLIRTKPDSSDPRRSSYSKYDIQALVERKRGSRRRTDIATGAIAWGESVLESAISTVRDGQLIFRGREAA